MKNMILTLMAVAALGLAGCQTTGGQKQTWGTGLGALAGGLAGSQVGSGSGRLWATGAGVLLGGLLGSEIGASLDKADMAYAQQAQNSAMTSKVGETITWNNPQSGNSGTYTATRDGYSDSNRYCREYQQTINVGGRKETGYGTACQKPNGDWEIIN
ncbi:RT0821/Lpp0805 family surface protein [Micavibrio aeruginosavorus]|uniref:17 kDa surface antigen family protein n=1 Tax=Micavibrio aeruginosavorus (strain ARL-13) TaxID=856793 RepID=G2KR83_MICAA|nr:RT0821/Lpp0805 family surface protein [Micavibrio aeruginosavorus]AEP09130.1 17 kDa surface antigen family protein [Micavibrio aeruginosavorus ARL-13]